MKGIDFPRNKHKFVNCGFSFAILGFFFFIGLARASPSTLPQALSDDDGICHTKVCEETANSFSNNMDKTVQPCDNFYQYACGNFIKNTQIADHQVVDTFSKLEDDINKQLNQSLNTSSSPNDRKPLRLVKKFYQSCMNTEKIEAEGISEVVKITKKLGGWPVVEGDSWKETGFDWLNATYTSRKLGYPASYIMTLKVSNDVTNFTKRVISISKPSFDLLHPKYLENAPNDEKVQAYFSYIVAIAETFGANRSRVYNEMLEVLRFQHSLAFIASWTTKNDKIERMTVSTLEKNFPSIPWRQYINAQLPKPLEIREDDVISVAAMDYISKLKSLFSQTSKRTIANYIVSKVVLSMVPLLSKNVRAHQLTMHTKMYQTTKLPERWEVCIRHARKLFPVALSSVYVRDHFSREIQPTDDVRDIVMRLKDEFVNMFQESDWSDYATQLLMLSKLATMSAKIRNPKELLDDQKIDEYYKELELPEDSLLNITLKIHKFNADKSLATLREPFTKNDWITVSEAINVNAHYMMTLNAIHIPTALMHGTFFNKERPKYVNYGTLGFILAHEMAHAFDRQGVAYNKDTSLSPILTDNSDNPYRRRTQCIINQYSNYTVKEVGIKLDGQKTSDENFSDNVGLRAAYLAYNQWIEDHAEEKKLPGIDASPKQLFWLSFANTWCSKYRLNVIKHRFIVDPHSPAEARVILSLKNMPEFAKDYLCPSTSNMNTNDRCPPLF